MQGSRDAGWLDTADHVVLVALMARFAQAIDRCDWVAYRSVFTDSIDLDYSSWRAGSVGRWAADDWVARAAALFPGFTGTQHAITNVLVEPGERPGSARVRASVRADHAITEQSGTRVFTLHGYYDDICESTSIGWKIGTKRLVVEWTTGDPTVMDDARERAVTRPRGAV